MPQDTQSSSDSLSAIRDLEHKIFELTEQLNAMRRDAVGAPVPDYAFQTLEGTRHLSELFGGRNKLLAIHNMGQGCRYCTLWADGINGFLPHLESELAVVLLSKDPPAIQRGFANARGWRFRLASHGGGDYIREQSTAPGVDNMPGAVLYELDNGKILRKNAVTFGPGDLFCSVWNLLALAGFSADSWTPQFGYWQRPATLDDGGLNVLE